MSLARPVAVIGAGPYGLATAAFLRHAGVPHTIFGRPMSYWEEDMPRGMWLRSRRRSAHIADPGLGLSIEDYERETGERIEEPIRVAEFAKYGRWYASRAVPEIDARTVERLERAGSGFELTLGDGGTLAAGRVVVATGLKRYPRRPPELGGLPRHLVTHTSDCVDFARLAGRSVVVLGGGQSAIEAAALLHEAGAARVELITRGAAVHWLPGHQDPSLGARVRRMMVPPTDVGGRVTGWIAAAPGVFNRLPAASRAEVLRRCARPAGAAWLRSRVEGIEVTAGRAVTGAAPSGDGVRLELGDGSAREVDHVVLGTGFEIDLARVEFLDRPLLAEIETTGGYPLLGPALESSAPGLHFAGAVAAVSLGPLMRHVVGTWYAAPALVAAARDRRPRAASLSYRPRLSRPTLGPVLSRGR